MKQSRRHSLVEVCVDTAFGFLVAWILTFSVLPYWGFHPSPVAAVEITLVYTIASMIRKYLFRRAFTTRLWHRIFK